MDRTGIGYIVLAGLLVFGLFAFANYDQTKMAAARTETEIRLDREPAPVKAVTELGMTVLAKVIVGTLTSLIVAAGVLAYQSARIRELKDGGWKYFMERRIPPKVRGEARSPSVKDLVMMLLAQTLKDKDRR